MNMGVEEMGEACFLLVALKPDLTVGMSTSNVDEAGSIELGDTVYRVMGSTGFTGFTDWLRNTNGLVVGVRFSPFEDLEFLLNVAKPLKYTLVEADSKCLNIYFSDEHLFDESTSDDQAFGHNYVYKSEDGEYLITFNAAEVKKTLHHALLNSLAASSCR